MMNLRTYKLLFGMVALTSALSFATASSVEETIASYPLIMWAHNSLLKTQEFETPLSKTDVLQKLNSQADLHQANLVVVAMKKQLSTSQLLSQTDQLNHLKHRILQTSQVYLNVNNALDSENLSQELTSLHYNIESINELDVLKTKLVEDLSATSADAAQRTYAFVTVNEQVNVSGFDTIMKEIEENLAQTRSSNFMLAMIGTKGNLIQESLNSFLETGSRVLALQELASIPAPDPSYAQGYSPCDLSKPYTANTFPCLLPCGVNTASNPPVTSNARTFCINQYITPNALNGIVISLLLAFFFIVVGLQLFYVQTPSVIVGAPIDFGKIEK